MDNILKSAVILKLIKALDKEGSWCGETHIQKAMYFLQELLGINAEFDFILYKHGPYSFDLKNRLQEMRVDNLITLEPTPPYGVVFGVGGMGEVLIKEKESNLENLERKINFVAENFKNKGVSELEKVATALFVTKELPSSSPEERAKYLNELKPHISLDSARVSLSSVQTIVANASSL